MKTGIPLQFVAHITVSYKSNYKPCKVLNTLDLQLWKSWKAWIPPLTVRQAFISALGSAALRSLWAGIKLVQPHMNLGCSCIIRKPQLSTASIAQRVDWIPPQAPTQKWARRSLPLMSMPGKAASDKSGSTEVCWIRTSEGSWDTERLGQKVVSSIWFHTVTNQMPITGYEGGIFLSPHCCPRATDIQKHHCLWSGSFVACPSFSSRHCQHRNSPAHLPTSHLGL